MGLFDRMWGAVGRRVERGLRLPSGVLPSGALPSGVGRADSAALSEHDTRPFRHAGRRADSVYNTITMAGDPSTDKGMAGRPNPFVIGLSDEELRLLWTFNGLARKIVELPATRATRKGWSVPEVPPAEERRLHVWERTREAMTWSRLYGGATLAMITDDDMPQEYANNPVAWLAQPLDLRRVRSLRALQVFDTFEAQVVAYNRDLRSPGFRGPEMWQISTEGYSARIHASRMLWFRGARRSPSEMRGGYNRSARMPDDSVLQAVWDEIRRLTEIMQGGATLAHELRETLIKISGLASITTSDQAETLRDRLQIMAQQKNMHGYVVLDKEDDYENRSNPATGYSELSTEAKEMLSAVTGIPQMILFGSSPAGLNTDGEASWEGFRQMVSDYQEQHRENLEQLYRVICAAQDGPTNGVVPDEIALTFAPLDEPSARQTAELRQLHAQTDIAYVGAGVLTAEHVARSRFGEDGYSNDILPVEETRALGTAAEGATEGATGAVGEDPSAIDPASVGAVGALGNGAGGDPTANTSDNRAALDTLYPERRDAGGDGVFVTMPAPDVGPSLRSMVEQAIGQRLNVPTTPAHVTVLYVGEGIRPRFELPEVVSVVEDEATDVQSHPLCHGVLRAFPPGPHGTPVVIELQEAWAVQLMHERLLRRLAHRVTQRQHRLYRPHVTIGYAPADVSVEAVAKMLAINVSEYVVPVTLFEVRSGGDIVATFAAGAEPVRE